MKKYAFLDANIFLHYKVEDIDWCKILGADEVDIVICSVVMDELDDIKHRSIKNVSERARNIIPKLTSSFEEKKPFKPNVNIIIETEPPSVDWSAEGLNKEKSDDQIIARIIERKNENDVFITADSIPRIKASKKHLKTIKLEESDRRPYEKTDDEKELEELRQLKDGLPYVSIELLNVNPSEPVPTFNIKQTHILDDKEIDDIIKKEQEEFDSIIISENANAKLGIPIGSPFPMDTYRFEKEIKEYLPKLREYIKEQNNYEEELSRIIPLDFKLHSTGKKPAEHVRCFLNFPKDIEILEEKDLPEEPEKPKKPVSIPSFIPDLGRMLVRTDFSSLASMHRTMLSQETMYDQDINKDKNCIDMRVKKITHGLSVSAEQVFIRVPSQDNRIFEIEYSIHIDNLKEKINGKIPIRIVKIS